MFDLSRISASALVARIDYHESIGSTNDRALTLAAAGESDLPLLVLAERQTAGRGRGANRWWSADGALLFSLALEAPRERLPAERWPHVAFAAGVAVGDALTAICPASDIRLKWPNDVYLNKRKVCGILSESVPGWRDRLVVGIGVNVNNSIRGPLNGRGSADGKQAADRTETLAFVATSLLDFDGLQRDLTTVLLTVLDELDRQWRILLDNDFSSLVANYRRRCFLTGKTVTIEQPVGQRLIGKCLGIADNGALCVRGAGWERLITSGTVIAWEG